MMSETTNSYKRPAIGKLITWLFFAVWLAFNLFLCINHEPFRDEAQSWFIAKDNSIPGMIGFMWQEGHPWLFHLILWPFAHLGFPFAYIKYIGFVIGVIAMFIYVKKAPFSTPFLCATMFLPFINYYTTAFARPYCLMMLGSVLIGLSWKTRNEKPWFTGLSLALLACSHIMCIIPAGILFIYLVSQNILKGKFKISGVLSFIIPCVIFYAPVIPQATHMLSEHNIPSWILIPCACIAIAAVVAVIAIVVHSKKGKSFTRKKRSFIAYSLIISAVIAALQIGVCYVMTSMTESAFMTNRYKLCAVPVFVCCMLWIFSTEYTEFFGERIKKKGSIAATVTIIVLCILLVVFGFCNQIFQDIVWLYSTGEVMADYINENVEDDAVILVQHQGLTTPVAAYLDDDHHLTVPQTGSTLHYTKWFTEWDHHVEPEEWKKMLADYNSQYDNVYILASIGSDFIDFYKWIGEKEESGDVEVVYNTVVPRNQDLPGVIDQGEMYFLFKLKGGNI